MQRYRHILVPLVVLLVTAAVLGAVRNHDFVKWDDDANIYANPHFNPVTTASILQFWRQPYEGTYRPLAYTLWGAVAAIAPLPAPVSTPELGSYSLSARPFHLFNLFLHLLNVLLVFVILRRLLRHERAAATGALLFGIHPAQVETVAWVTGMNDALYTCFGLLALWLYIRFARPAGENSGQKQAWGFYALATFFFFCALLCKPAAVAVPLVALAIDYWILKRPLRQSTPVLGAWVILAIACAFITREAHTITNPAAIPPLQLRPLIAGDALAFYLSKLIWPRNLAIDYGRSPGYVLIATHQAYWTWILPVGLAVLLFILRKRRPMLVAAGLIFVAALLPVLGFVPFSFQQFSTVADRYLYFAMLGPALALAWIVTRERAGVLRQASVVLLVLLSIATSTQVQYWQNTTSLFRHTLEVNADSYYSHLTLGEIASANKDTDAAVRHYSEALRINPNSWVTHSRLGFALEALGDRAGAVEQWKQALALNPDYAPARRALEQARQLQKAAPSRQPRKD